MAARELVKEGLYRSEGQKQGRTMLDNHALGIGMLEEESSVSQEWAAAGEGC